MARLSQLQAARVAQAKYLFKDRIYTTRDTVVELSELEQLSTGLPQVVTDHTGYIKWVTLSTGPVHVAHREEDRAWHNLDTK